MNALERLPLHLRPHAIAVHARWWLGDRMARRHYRFISEAELLATRTSDTAFVFGSGRSLLDVTREDWRRIAECNTISVREFPRQHWIRADYHISGEIDDIDEYAQRIRENPLYANTVFVAQCGFRAWAANALVARGLLPYGARVFRYRRVHRGEYAPPSTRPAYLVHGHNSIFDATNFAVALGFSRVVLAGADYYNKEYFWLEAGKRRPYEARDIVATAPWPQARAIVDMMGSWRAELERRDVDLLVFDERSLLAKHLPVFRF